MQFTGRTSTFRVAHSLSAPSSLRQFRTSLPRHDLVGPSDPISNLRLVIYDDAPPETRHVNLNHPYSLKEFTGDAREYQWKLQRQQLDLFNHSYWADSNARFEAAKTALLESLPTSTTEEGREFALSDFYGRWLAQEEVRHRAYHQQWSKQNWSTIWLGARVKFGLSWSRMTSVFT